MQALKVEDSAAITRLALSTSPMTGPGNASRLLGAAFLAVVATSLGGGLLQSTAVGSGGTSQMLVSIASHLSLMRLSILADLVTSVGIIALAVLLYTVLRNQSRIAALIALGCWLCEAFVLAIAKIGTAALIPISQQFVSAGAPSSSYYQTLGDFLYNGIVVQLGQTTHMFFYCVGGILWYFLFFKSDYVPRLISLFGLAAVSVGLAGIVLQFLGVSVSIFVFLPILPFELAIGAWLMLGGIRDARLVSTQA